jgi:S-adenosylmethionine:tRNA ribosyltransferase-isomerase
MGLKRQDFSFDLPAELIAQTPPAQRGASRLLAVGAAGAAPRDLQFADLPMLLQPGDLLVRNNTRVVAARIQGHKTSGGAVEILLERVLSERLLTAQVRASKGTRVGQTIVLPDGASAQVVGHEDGLVQLQLDRPVLSYLEAHGALPLPPYITRAPSAADRERYQTVYAQALGAVAAPTAGLHFSDDIFHQCTARGVSIAEVTLHVGAGTFQPIRTDDLDQHRLHAEWLSVPTETVAAIQATRARGGRVVAIGTTVVRSLETAASSGQLLPYEGETRLFIRPGFRFRVVDAMLTNFHLSESTLLMLVCAFGSRARVLAAYAHAVRERYRFFSYGDAMWLEAALEAPKDGG